MLSLPRSVVLPSRSPNLSANQPQFESTVIIPTVSPDKTPSNDVQSFWPGMEPKTMNGVFQNVITNQAAEPGEWYLLPFYCCKYAQPLFSTSTSQAPKIRHGFRSLS